MDRVVPFNIKRVDRARVELSGLPGVESLQVRVNLLLYERKIARLASLTTSTRLRIESDMIRDSREHLTEEFVRLLRLASHPVAFFPHDLLADYPLRHYYLLLERRMANELLSLWGDTLQSGRTFQLSRYQIHTVAAPILYEEAYLVAKDKYRVFLYPRSGEDGVRVYRSDFLDARRDTPPALTFHSQDVIEVLQQTAAQRLGVSVEAINSGPPERRLERCPECGGPVQHLGGDAYFCLECEWDNLEPIPPNLLG